MPKFKAKTKDCQLIVKAKFSSSEKINDRELDFFARKYIRGFMKPSMKRKWGAGYIEYTGPIGISLQERLNRTITRYEFFFMIEQVVDIVQKTEKNALDLNKIIFSLPYVYINEITKEMQFIYTPLIGSIKPVNLKSFIESIIYSVHPAPEQDTEYISKFAYLINGMPSFEADKVEEFISCVDKSIIDTIKKHGNGGSGFMTDKPRDYYAHYDTDDEATGLLDESEETGLLVESEETGLLEDEEGTTLMNETVRGHFPSLHRGATGETILVNKSVFRLGRDKSFADYLVADNSAVSGNHADIVIRECGCFVMDLNSRNHTYINDRMIPPGKETEISDGDRLRLANEEFVFYL